MPRESRSRSPVELPYGRSKRKSSRHQHRRDSRSRSQSRSHRRDSRSRSRWRSCRSNTRRRSNRHRSHSGSRDSGIYQALNTIMARLNAVEENTASTSRMPPPRSSSVQPPPLGNDTPNTPQNNEHPGPSVCSFADALFAITRMKQQDYFVSNFDPNLHDFESWCHEVERARSVNQWGELECLSRVANCLRGNAKLWLNEWSTNDRSWTNFKKEFKSLCPQRINSADILLEVMSTTSDRFPTYAEYARRSLLRLRIVKGLSEELMTEIVIRGITDAQIRAAAINANLSVENIVSFLGIYVKPNRTNTRDLTHNRISKNRSTSQSNSRCYICNKTGHVRNSCPKRTRPSENTSKLVCSFCKKAGHEGSRCFAKSRSENSNSNQRKVNLCKELSNNPVNNDICTAVIQGIPVDVLIDSGALNISLISSDIVKYFSCARKPTYCVLKGVSSEEIIAHEFITLTIEFSHISLEVDLVIVPSSCMNTPIIIGTDVLNRDGVTFFRTKDKQYLTRSTSQSASKVNNVTANNLSDVNTPLKGKELYSLTKVLSNFLPFLISGTATTTVKTGEMKIKLTSDVPVTYHPYRLSYPEKLKVREIIKELLDKGIIRESTSEYASPIILVKKKDGTDRMCVDFRALNRITVKDRYPLPLIEDHIDRLGAFKYFTSLDMASGFH